MTLDINKQPHKSVLVNEVITYLDPQPHAVYLDATFGAGGHTRAILQQEITCQVIALDWDMASLETYGVPLQEEFPGRLRLIWGNFALLYKLLKKENIDQVNGVLADFGTSQMQIALRPGFSFSRDSALDMRMSPSHQKITAADIVNTASQEELATIFWQYGEERLSRRIAQAIVHDRAIRSFQTTQQLAQLIERLYSTPSSAKTRIHPATRVFQALRIVVNKELDNISALLAAAMPILKPGGRLVCISFHSLEDRIVKQFFKQQQQLGQLEILTPQVIVASQEEMALNPSSRSAHLRVAQRN